MKITYKALMGAVAGLAIAATAAFADITGAGASFPFPIYAKWAAVYKGTSGVGLNYQSIGSGGGIAQIKAKTVAFGATDKPLTPKELAASGLTQFPTVIGGVVPVINVPGIAPGQLKLSGSLLAEIYLGNIKKWNDPQIAAINPGVKLPNLPLTVVHRSDGSGTSFIFTTYLSVKSPAWASKVGGNDAVEWPVGLGGKGNDGVAGFVKQTIGSIGYVEYAFALQNHMTHVSMQNKAGAFVQPTAANFAAAAARADWAHAPGYYLILVDQAGPTTWPIVGATFILMHKSQANAATGQSVLKFFDWAYKNGDALASSLDYIALPAAVKNQVRATWVASIKGPNGAAVYTP
ncbi:MAG TPA: phosphate ABC transporter substrate-binding protein PstS [Caulobacteraceae bacterium]|nr:phosphate ABC transporter substrate-binding protein PstS [Caulobacteraceae bacterium]